MKYIKQLGIIFSVCWLSAIVEHVLPFPFPASVIGMLLMLVLLLTGILKIEQVQDAATFLLANMTFFFVPTCVGILKYTDVLFSNFWAIVLISILTTPLVFFVTGHVVQLTMKKIKEKGETEK